MNHKKQLLFFLTIIFTGQTVAATESNDFIKVGLGVAAGLGGAAVCFVTGYKVNEWTNGSDRDHKKREQDAHICLERAKELYKDPISWAAQSALDRRTVSDFAARNAMHPQMSIFEFQQRLSESINALADLLPYFDGYKHEEARHILHNLQAVRGFVNQTFEKDLTAQEKLLLASVREEEKYQLAVAELKQRVANEAQRAEVLKEVQSAAQHSSDQMARSAHKMQQAADQVPSRIDSYLAQGSFGGIHHRLDKVEGRLEGVEGAVAKVDRDLVKQRGVLDRLQATVGDSIERVKQYGSVLATLLRKVDKMELDSVAKTKSASSTAKSSGMYPNLDELTRDK